MPLPLFVGHPANHSYGCCLDEYKLQAYYPLEAYQVSPKFPQSFLDKHYPKMHGKRLLLDDIAGGYPM